MSSTEDYIKRTFLGSILDLKIRTPKFIHNSGQSSYSISSGSRAHSSAPFNYALPSSSKVALHNDQRQRQIQQVHPERRAQQQQEEYQQHNERYVQNQQSFGQEQRPTLYPIIQTNTQQQHQQFIQEQQYLQAKQQLELERGQQQQSKCENRFFEEQLYCGPTANLSLSDHLSERLFLASPTTSSSTTTCNSPTQTSTPMYDALPFAYNDINTGIHLTDYSNHLAVLPNAKDAFSSPAPYVGEPPTSWQSTTSTATVNLPHDNYYETFLNQRCNSRYVLEPEGPVYRTNNAYMINKKPCLVRQRRLTGRPPTATFHHEKHASYDNRIYSHIDGPITFTTTSEQQQKTDSTNCNAGEVLPPRYPPPPPYDQHYESPLVAQNQFCNVESVAFDTNFEVDERFVKTLIEKLASEILNAMDAERFTQFSVQRRVDSEQISQQLNAILNTLLPLEKLSLEQLIKMIITAVKDTRKDDNAIAPISPLSATPANADAKTILSYPPPSTEVAVPLPPPCFTFSPASPRRVESTVTTSETPEEILQRKRQQNNLAAARYRKRQREAKILAQSEIFDLERQNTELKNKILTVRNEINALKRKFVAKEPSSPIQQSPLQPPFPAAISNAL